MTLIKIQGISALFMAFELLILTVLLSIMEEIFSNKLFNTYYYLINGLTPRKTCQAEVST